jgi:signal transduction histidine kinase
LVYQHETLGQLLLGPRAPNELFGLADRRLLEEIARQAGIAAHAVRLTADLQRSRERLVAAREEERRRLRRDLHDGLGPALSGVLLRIGAARRLLPASSPADPLLAEAGMDLRATVADVRRLVYDLRPPALDQLGLVHAIREQAEQYSMASEADGEPGARVEVRASGDLPPLPAAVEVAAYRIAQEALANMARHARARTCTVRLALQGRTGADASTHEHKIGRSLPAGPVLRLEIFDDGLGLPSAPRAGVGLTSMRERAAELGGTCIVERGPTGGTRVQAQLPLGNPAPLLVVDQSPVTAGSASRTQTAPAPVGSEH